MTRARDLSKFANSQAFSVDSDFQVGINSTVPAATLDVRGDSVITGILTATSHDATGLTGTPDITVNNIVAAAATFSGVITYEDVTNVDSVGVVTARLGINVSGGEIAVGAAFSVGQAGVVTATSFAGNLSGGTVSGTTGTFTGDVDIADKIIHTGDTNTAIRFPAADTFTVETGGSERLRITSAGLVGLGTASPGSELHLQAGDSNCAFKIVNTSGGSGGLIQVNGSDFNFNNLDSGIMRFYTADTERVRITSDGKMGVGENSPQQRLHVSSTSSTYIQVQNTGDSVNAYYGVDTASAWAGSSTNHPFKLHTNNTERLRIDTSGRLLCGHTSSIDTGGVESQVQVVGTDTEKSSLCLARFVNDSGEPFLIFAKSRNGTKGGNTVVQDDDTIGRISFQGADGTDYEEAASIKGEVDGSPAGEATDMPGRLLFGTTADGDHNATERLRIDSVGTFHFKNGLMIENGSTGTTARNGTQNVDLDAGMVRYYSTASTGTWKPNFRVSSSVSINSLMGTSDVISPTMIVAKGATTHFANAIQVDGSDVTPEFLGGAPTDGGGSGTFDVYNYTIIKTGDAAFKAFASVSTYE